VGKQGMGTNTSGWNAKRTQGEATRIRPTNAAAAD
jgi:hypothetical protein